MRTVKILGQEYVCRALTDDRSGIITDNCTFKIYPACCADGAEAEPLPSAVPLEIRVVSFEYPDLTDDYPDEVRDNYNAYHVYWMTVTLDERALEVGSFPSKGEGESKAKYEKRLKVWRKENASEFDSACEKGRSLSYEQYKAGIGIYEIWEKHQTQELAEKYNFKDETVEASLQLGLRSRYLSKDQIADIIGSIKYEAIYSDPDETIIYLRGVNEEPLTLSETTVTQGAPAERAEERTEAWHSSTYETIWYKEPGSDELLSLNLTKTQSLFVGALDNTPLRKMTKSELQDAVCGANPISEFRPRKMFENGKPDGDAFWSKFISYHDKYYHLIPPNL